MPLAGSKAGSAVKYMTLPGLIPRIRELFFNGFDLLAYYIALIYGRAKIIPAGHPYLNPDNIGRFGVLQAVAAAWKYLDFRWKNIDRIVFFFALISGLGMMLFYIVGAVFLLFTAPAMAATIPSIGGLFTNPNTHDDIAFMMMDRVLGIPGIYNSKVITDAAFGVTPTPFQIGLQVLFAYFSWAIFGFAVLMLLYFVVEIVLETTMTGTPFGKHLEDFWAPLRIVAGLGLLIPVSHGLNSAQWITLYTAKAGSNLASNAWIAFNEGMENPLGMSNAELVALPATPDFTGLAKDLFTIRACKDIDQKLVRGDKTDTTTSSDGAIVITGTKAKDQIDAYFVNGKDYFNILGHAHQNGLTWPGGYNNNFLNLYLKGLQFYKGGDIRIVFGRFNEENYKDGKFPGGVEPVCGEVLIPNMLPAGQEIPQGFVTNADVNQGLLIGASHMYAVLNMVIGISKTGFGKEGSEDDQRDVELMQYATDRYYYQGTSKGQKLLQDHRENTQAGNGEGNPDCIHDDNNDGIDNDGDMTFDELGDCTGPVDDQFFVDLAQKYQRYFSYGPIMGLDYYTGQGQAALNKRCAAIDCGRVVSGAAATCQRALESCQKTRDGYNDYKPLPSVYYEDLGQTNPFLINRAVQGGLFKYGWGGAGIWYKLIAEKNGELTSATNTLPRATHFPRLMEIVSNERTTTNKNVSAGVCERFNPQKTGDKPIALPGNVNDSHEMAAMYYQLCNQMQLNEHMNQAGSTPAKTGKPVIDIINAIFGMNSLYSFRENSAVNPMSALATLGRALIDKAILSISLGAGGTALGGIITMFGNATGDTGMGLILAGGGAIVTALSKLLVSFAFTGLVAGVLLYYVLPFLPFMYFFFAVGAWVKTVFEALVGVPLWALAHVKLDGGPGFSGQAASGGYMLLLEILIRPILTLFSLLASMIVFMAVASMLNTVWGMVTSNAVGFDPLEQISSDPLKAGFYRPRLDQFAYMLMYIIIIYMAATSSFKLIDQIPDGIMRWIKEVKTMGQNDNAEELVGQATNIVTVPLYYEGKGIVTEGVDLLEKAPAGIGGVVGDLSRMMPDLPKAPPPANNPPYGGGGGEGG